MFRFMPKFQTRKLAFGICYTHYRICYTTKLKTCMSSNQRHNYQRTRELQTINLFLKNRSVATGAFGDSAPPNVFDAPNIGCAKKIFYSRYNKNKTLPP